MRTVRCLERVLGALAAVLLTVPGLLLAIPPAQANTVQASTVQASTVQEASSAQVPGLAISISGITPEVATQKSTVTLSGTLANHTGAAVSGIIVQGQTSTALFNGRAEMTSFSADGSYPYPLQAAGSPEMTGSVPNGVTERWSVSFPAGTFFDQFGVFPLQVQAATADGAYTAAARTFLPFWPGGDSASQPEKLQVAWVWPLVDAPQQGACARTLSTARLAGSLSPGGRLSTLLDAGATWAKTDDLTWDIDPALLSDVSVMTRSYFTLGNAACTGRSPQPPSPAAAKWLAALQTSAAGEPAFLTPYANVDEAALSHAGLDANLRSAYLLGESVAGQLLPGTFGADGRGTGAGAVLKAAWPAGGEADAGVLTSLADDGGISTVVLNSSELRSSTPGYDNALARTTSGTGTSMSVLLADSGITGLLGSAVARPTAAGQFALTQDFLAQTAMISSEAPNKARSLVIAPPTNWDPSPAEAKALLSITHSAPWLRPVGLSALASAAAKVPSQALPANQVSPHELSRTYLDGVKKVDANLSVFTNLLYQPSPGTISSLNEAVAATESAAWRGTGSPGGWLAMTNLLDYLEDSEHKVQIIPVKKILLTGNSGETPVSVQNGLSEAVRVQVTASTPAGSQVRVGPHAGLLTVLPEKTNTVRLPVHAASIGTTTVQLQLVTQDGSPLTWTVQSLSVEVTRVGRFLLTVIGGALGILVLTSAYRLRRRRRLASAGRPGTDNATADAGGDG
jgi:Family of unknown function (DUF6049)